MLGCRVIQFKSDLDPLRSSPDESINATSKDVSGKAALLMAISGAHRLDNPNPDSQVVSEQPIRYDIIIVVVHHQIQIGSIQRRLLEPSFEILVVA